MQVGWKSGPAGSSNADRSANEIAFGLCYMLSCWDCIFTATVVLATKSASDGLRSAEVSDRSGKMGTIACLPNMSTALAGVCILLSQQPCSFADSELGPKRR